MILQEKPKEHNSDWPKISDYLYEIIITGVSGSGKRNALLNLINHQRDIDKIYLYAKDPYEAKYQFLINKRENVCLKHCNGSIVFMEYSNMNIIHDNIHST